MRHVAIESGAGPLYGEEGIVSADCDLREGLRAKRWFDSVGHYSRADVLLEKLHGSDGASEAGPREAGAGAEPSADAPQ